MARVDLPTTPAAEAAPDAAQVLRMRESLRQVIESISGELEIAADHLAVAIQNSRAFEQVRRLAGLK